jgi:hypothetical protein
MKPPERQAAIQKHSAISHIKCIQGYRDPIVDTLPKRKIDGGVPR